MSAAGGGAVGGAWTAARADARLLAEIALAAGGAGLGDAARPIVALLARLEPDHPAAAIASAVGAMAANRPEEAVETLRRDALGKARGQDAARGVLLVALVAAGRQDEARRLADEVLAGPDLPARRMAMTLRPALGGASPSQAGAGRPAAAPQGTAQGAAQGGAPGASPQARGVR